MHNIYFLFCLIKDYVYYNEDIEKSYFDFSLQIRTDFSVFILLSPRSFQAAALVSDYLQHNQKGQLS